jgi:predicted DNA-binding protein (MmcQ/YjbR family)
MLSELQILTRLREICLKLPGARETVTFGHPTFQVRGKTFLVLETYKGELGVCVKVEKELQGIFLEDQRFFRTPYIGKHGWITLKVYAARLNWTELKALARGSYLLISAPRPHDNKAAGAKGRTKREIRS